MIFKDIGAPKEEENGKEKKVFCLPIKLTGKEKHKIMIKKTH